MPTAKTDRPGTPSGTTAQTAAQKVAEPSARPNIVPQDTATPAVPRAGLPAGQALIDRAADHRNRPNATTNPSA
jgi:hypothetical protein